MNLPASIADALLRGATVVAATPRTARALQLAFASDRRAEGREVWPAPPILDWDSWLRELWYGYTLAVPDAPVLLTPLQELALWARMMRGDAHLVLSPPAMADLAMQAWQRLSAYNAHPARRFSWEQSDAERFRHWAQDFDRECAARNWLSPSLLPARLAAVPPDPLNLPPELCFVGFDRLTPAQQEFLASLRAHRIAITEYAPAAVDSQRSWVAASDRREEISACAAWARSILLENPSARVGVLVPDIESCRGELERAFRRSLASSADDIRQPTPILPFEFSLGRPLASVPAVRAALLLLRWLADPLPHQEISWLLLSGFLADTVTDRPAVLRYDSTPRTIESLLPEQSFPAFLGSLLLFPALHHLHLQGSELLQAVRANQLLEVDRAPSAWVELVHLLLDTAGWPGQRPPDSVQFQALQRWQRLLDDLALLDFDGSRLGFRAFFALLERHARETIFAPESHDAPVQIMGPLESAGQHFDALWFLSADDSSWPGPSRLLPLLPPAVQRQYEMPHATPDDAWKLAHKVTARLLTSAPRIVFSYAQRQADAELRPSRLIAGLFSAADRPEPAARFLPAPDAAPPPARQPIPDDSAPLPWPRERSAGGSEILRRQAACPFQSFARRRLAAEPLDASQWGLSPADRGSLLHHVLHRLFRQNLRTQEDILAAIRAGQIAAAVEAQIENVFRDVFGVGPLDPWQDAYLAAEKRSLLTRLLEWLPNEADRVPFIVEACEQVLHDVRVGDLRLRLRADRIDRLPGGARLLIDYKTGHISPAAWKSDRPDEPQLPLYAVYGNVENLCGVLLAKIRPGETGFAGRVRDARAQLCPNAKGALVADPYTEEMRDQWAAALRSLAQEFLVGDASVTPRDPDVCKQCPLPALCRIAEHNHREFAAEPAESSAFEEPADA